MELDWGDGDYARTAALLAPAAEVLVDAVEPRPGATVADIACGTGNVAIAAAARGALVTGVDVSASLVERARARAAREGATARFFVGDAGALPLADDAFDTAVSCFGVIFAPDPARAAAEMVRVKRPGGVIALTSWGRSGAVAAAGRVLREAFPTHDAPGPAWDDPDWVRNLLAGAGAPHARVSRAALAFRAASPAAWLDEQEEHHPVWRAIERSVSAAAWSDLRARMLRRLTEENEDRDAFLATSRYLVVVARRATVPTGGRTPPDPGAPRAG